MRRLLKALFLFQAFVLTSASSLAETKVWVFEGLLSKVDPVLAPDLKSGWVLAGSFELDPLELQEEYLAEDSRSGRLAGGISGTELTVDLYYSVKFEAVQASGMSGFDFNENDPENDKRDLLAWYFPMRGDLGETGWSVQWLQVWLNDPAGNMLRTVPPPVPPAGFAWKSGWFRLSFSNDKGEAAHAEGHLNIFSPEDALEGISEEDRLTGMVAELSSQLQERDSRISALEDQLAESTERLNSVRRMVDLLYEERSQLLDENNRLSEQAELANPEAQAKMAELLSEQALLEQNITELDERNRALAESLGESERNRRELLRELQDLEEEKAATEEEKPTAPAATGSVKSADGRSQGTITVYERPMIIEKPVPVRIEREARPTTAPENGNDKTSERRRYGPRKFR